MNLLDRDQKWSDYSEFEIPEAVGVTASDRYLGVIRDKLVSMLNHFSWVNQFIPDIQFDVEKLKYELKIEERRQHYVLQKYVANNKEVPAYYKRSKDLLIAYIEGKTAVGFLKDSDDRMDKIVEELNDKRKEVNDLTTRRESLKAGIESCQSIIDSILWELKNAK